jgi:hypothetical protein
MGMDAHGFFMAKKILHVLVLVLEKIWLTMPPNALGSNKKMNQPTPSVFVSFQGAMGRSLCSLIHHFQ